MSGAAIDRGVRMMAQLHVAAVLDRGHGADATTLNRVEMQAVADLMADYLRLREMEHMLRPEVA